MEDQTQDQPVLKHIQDLIEEEHRLYAQARAARTDDTTPQSPGGLGRLEKLQVELDQCWDLLRQRRALRDAGFDPNQAHARPADVVESYEQ
jgi:hypothetical protein